MTKLSVQNLLCNRLLNPLGFNLGDSPSLSWTVSAPAQAQVETRVEISDDETFSNIIFDSGLQKDINSICFRPQVELSPRTRYSWRVTVSSGGEKAIEKAWFETSKMDEPWQAMWISPDFDPSWHPVIFSGINLPAKVKEARAYVSGLGIYELSINGRRCGDEYLSPGLCAYDKWIPYQTYDVTESLSSGENLVEAALGNGWYKGRYGLDRKNKFVYGDEFSFIFELHVTCEDGSRHVLSSDLGWKARRGTVVDSSIFDGEVRDDNLDTSQVYGVKESAVSMALLEPRRSPPTKIMHRIRPIEIIKTPAGETVIDMGQNMTGWLSFVCRAPKGSETYLQFGEVLQQGNFYRDNLRTALAEYRYVSDGTEKTVRPMFTFYGFRYVKLTSWHQDVSLDDFEGHVLYSDMKPTGSIITGNAKVNKLFENTLWGQRGNFLDVPTDCPQRDERMGWTGDAQVFFGTAAYNMDVSAFYSKFCYDLMKEQMAIGGAVPVVIPKHDVKQTGACAWGDAATIIPWRMYAYYGDINILKQQYDSMKAWVEYIRRHDEKTGNSRLWKGDFHYCDWLALDGEDPIGNRFGGTERTYLASCYYRYSSMLVSKAAKLLGKDEDAKFYRELSDEVRRAIIKEYVTETGRLALTTQTAYILALHFDIIPEKWREQTAYALRLKLKESTYHLRTGFIGTPYLCRVLSATGSNDISYRLLMQEDFPSWLYEVNMGATTIWERWNSILPDGSISDTGMNSLNHYSYGSIVEWMYANAAGIQPIEEQPGFRKFRLAPQPDPLLGSIDASFESPSGLIKSAWQYLENGELQLCFTVPFGASALITLPDSDKEAFQVGPGEYEFKYLPLSAGEPKYNLDTPLSEILASPGAKSVLEQEFPKLTHMMIFDMMAGERSLNDFIREGFISIDKKDATAFCKRMTDAAAE
ncbi:MAG: family 78 glycoside hydrolase catalytic domain [Christensenellales bacterium]